MDPTPVLIAAAVALGLIAMAVAIRGEGGRSSAGAAAVALAPAAAVLTALYVFGKSLAVPPSEFLDWALLAGIIAMPVGLLAARGGASALASIAVVAAIAVVLFYAPTNTLHERYWDGRVATYVAALAGATTLAYAGRLAAVARGRTTEMSLAVGLAALAAAPALGLSGTVSSAMLAGALSSTAGLFGLVLLARPKLRGESATLGRAMAAPQTILFAGVLGNGVLYAETPRRCGAMLLLAPLVALVPGKGLPAAVVRLVIVAIVAGAAAWLSRGEPNPYADY